MCVMLQAGTALEVRGSSVREFVHSSKYIKTRLPMFRSSTFPKHRYYSMLQVAGLCADASLGTT
jgi:hypothetical protein